MISKQPNLHFAAPSEGALHPLAEICPKLIMILPEIDMPGSDGTELVRGIQLQRCAQARSFFTKPMDFMRSKQVRQLMPGSPG